MEKIKHGFPAFKPVVPYRPGIITSMLRECYAAILSAEPLIWLPEAEKWALFEKEVFENPDTIGKCVFITLLDGEIIGLDSYDPRKRPELGIISHNCILPRFQGKGYGKRQISEILDRFRTMGIQRAGRPGCVT